MRILVLGGTVFIGRATVYELVDAGHDVCVLHRGTHEPDDLASVEHIHVDRKEIASKRDEIEAFGPQVVWDNMALGRADSQLIVDVIGDAVRYLVTSSMDVYRAYAGLHAGRATDPLPIDETSPVREERYPYRGQIPGMDDYEKLDVEEVYLSRGATVLRLPMVYGPHDGQRREDLSCGACAPAAIASRSAAVRGSGRRDSSPTSRAASVSPSSRTLRVRSSTSARRARIR